MGKDARINSNIESSQLGFGNKTILHTSRGVIELGDNCGISNCCLNAKKQIKLGNNVRLGAGVKIYDNDFHNIYDIKNDDTDKIPTKEVILEDNVFVGAGSMILKGVFIGKGSIIGAGSVVTSDIPSGEAWAGNPAHYIKKVECKE